MSLSDRVTAALTANHIEERMGPINAAWGEIAKRVPGWSGNVHYLFFKSVLDAMPEIKTVLMLGVYMGRDITMILDAAKGRELQVVGVDRFADQPCDDWRVEQKTKSWTEAGFGPAPDAARAAANIDTKPPHAVRLIQADTLKWLPSVEGKFDFVYVDSSHDYETVKAELAGIRHLCHENTLIAGDDYVNDGKEWWGVDRAVKEAFTTHQVLAGMIWYAGREELK